MNITIRAQDFEMTRAINHFSRDNLRTSLARFRDDIVGVDVFLKDANGPRGGVDKQVLIRVNLRNRQQITLATTHEDMYAAIKLGVKRTKRAVRRHIRKARHFDKQRLQGLLTDAGITSVLRH